MIRCGEFDSCAVAAVWTFTTQVQHCYKRTRGRTGVSTPQAKPLSISRPPYSTVQPPCNNPRGMDCGAALGQGDESRRRNAQGPRSLLRGLAGGQAPATGRGRAPLAFVAAALTLSSLPMAFAISGAPPNPAAPCPRDPVWGHRGPS